MKDNIQKILDAAIQKLIESGQIPGDLELPKPQISNTRDPKHGNFASNIALILAKKVGQSPRELAASIIDELPVHSAEISQVQIAGPGFINFFISDDSELGLIEQIIAADGAYGNCSLGKDQSVLIEFVSANPTGPLHVGHGRGAAYGAALAKLLEAAGFRVTREYYINDAGRQMDILAISVWLRYLEHSCGHIISFPSNAYKGNYIVDIAQSLHAKYGVSLNIDDISKLWEGLPLDEPDGGDKEEYIDAIIIRSKQLLADRYQHILDEAVTAILHDIESDLLEFGVHFENWFSENQLVSNKKVEHCIEKLRTAGHLYEKNGALWFASKAFGDVKDRVILRENGQATYFASDIAYHLDKYERAHDKIINIWGADHHGYIARVKAAIEAMGSPSEKLQIILVQFAVLYRNQQKVSMSTRSGSFVSLRELREEVGNDAARFFYVMRRSDQHMDFDLELAKSESNENPVYYVQYAHARISSVFKQLPSSELNEFIEQGLQQLDKLTNDHEKKLLRTLNNYAGMIENAAKHAEPHQIVYYLRDLARDFHSYYNAHQFLIEDQELRNARLALIKAVQYILKHALTIIGVSAPENM